MVGKLIALYYRNALKFSGKRLVLYIFVGFSVLVTVGSQCLYFAYIGMASALPSLLYTANFMLCLITAIPSAKAILFGFRDLDLQLALPISTRTIVASRIGIFLLSEEVYSLFLLGPAFLTYGIAEGVGWRLLPSAILLIAAAPIVPAIIGTVLGTVAAALASRSKHTKIFQIVWLLVACFGGFYINIAIRKIYVPGSENGIADLTAALQTKFAPAQLFANAAHGSLPDLAIFVVMSAGLFLLFAWALGKVFTRMNSAVTAVRSGVKFRETGKTWSRSGQFAALIKKEFRLIFDAPVYLVNCVFGLIMLIATAVVLAAVPLEKIIATIGVTPDMLPENLDLNAIAGSLMPLALSILMTMSCTTCCAISIEGKRLAQLLAMPVNSRQILTAKLAVNLILNTGALIVCLPLILLRFRPNLLDAILCFVTPTVFTLFMSAFGLNMNLWLPKLDWTTEQQAIKQSASPAITILVGMFAAMIPLGLAFVFGGTVVAAVTSAGIGAIAIALTLVLVFGRMGRLQKLMS